MASRTAMTSRTRQPRGEVQPSWTGRSQVSTFIHCLHLLNLDQAEDWPGIDEETLTSIVAKQNLQNKIRSIEWSLYRLFELYDAEEARNKLRPFFPPTSSLQSVNLRAALYRCLAELKKNGVLGAHHQLRKTMLDECKGEKFEELIAGFALIVLRKVVGVADVSIVENIKKLKDDQVLALVLAHRVSLRKKIGEQQDVRNELEQFSTKIVTSRAALSARREELKARSGKQDPALKRQMATLVNSSWIGNYVWADLILRGLPPKPAYKEVISPPPAQASSQYVVDNSVGNLVDKLDATIHKHKARLAEWRVVAKDIKARTSAMEQSRNSPTRESAPPGKAYRFAQHKRLTSASSQPGAIQSREIGHGYQAILDALRDEISVPTKSRRIPNISYGPSGSKLKSEPYHKPALGTKTSGKHHPDQQPQPATRAAFTAPNATRTEPEINDSVLDIDEMQLEYANDNPAKIATGGITAKSPRQSVTTLHLDVDPTSSNIAEVALEEKDVQDSSPLSSLPDETSQTIWPAKLKTFVPEMEFKSPVKVSEQVPSPETTSKIVKSPASPTKEWMSLMDRTRASISNFGAFKDLPVTRHDTDYDKKEIHSEAQPDADKDSVQGQDLPTTLVSRTRQSMSLLSSAKPRAKRKSQRLSQLYPINQFETPGKPRSRLSEFGPSSESSTPREKLFEQEADYESVFKSRPRIAMSPAISPDRSGIGFDSILEQDMEDLQLASDDEYD